MPLLSTFGAASARGFGNLSGIEVPIDDLFNTVSALLHFAGTNNGTNNVFDDSSSSNHTITANGNVTQGSFGPFARPDGEWAVAFDGSADFIEGPSVDLLGSGAFTVECWVNVPSKTTASNFTDAFLAQYQSNGNLIIGSKFNVVRVWMGSSEVRVGTVGIVGNGWHHIALTRNSSGSVRLFVDGSADGAAFTNSTDFSQNLENFEIGSWDNGANSALNGNISNLRVVKGTAVYDPSASTITVPTSSLTAIANTSLLTCQSNRFVDNSTNSHTLTPSGQTAVSAFGPFLTSSVYSAGVNGASAYFDGSGDWLVASSGSTDFGFGTGDFTIEFWVNPNTVGSQSVLSMLTSASDTAPHIWLQNTLRFYDGGDDRITSSTIAVGQWYHVAVCRSSSSTKMFINGVQAGSTYSDSNDYGASKPCVVGSFYDSGSVYSGSTANSIISDVRIVKGTAVYTSAFTPPTAPLTAVTNTKLLLNMADGQAIDSAAQNNLTLYGDAKISNTQSKFGGTSLALDGTGDYAQTAPSSVFGFGTGAFTWEAWIYALSNTGVSSPYIFDFRGGGNNANGSFYINNTNSGRLEYYRGGAAIQGNTNVPLNQWVHVACVRSGTTVKLYQGGYEVGSGTDSADLGSSGQLFVAEYHGGGGYNFKGYIDEVRISNGTARYTSNFNPPTEAFADKGQ